MIREELAERLDQEIEAIRAGVDPSTSLELRSLLELAATFAMFPDPEFRRHLKAELHEHADSARFLGKVETPQGFDSTDFVAVDRTVGYSTDEFGSVPAGAIAGALSVPSLAHRELSPLPADPRSLLVSFVSHAALVALIVSGILAGHRTVLKPNSSPSELTYVALPIGETAPHGGGSGGDQNTIRASRGTPPKFSDQQLAPPVIVVHNPTARLQANATVLGPPDLKLPQSNQLGELLSPNRTMPSNGTGSEGGIGSNRGTGVGTGIGAGGGTGSGGGCCTGIYIPGNGIRPPRALYDPEPDYSEEARKVKLQGSVVLSLVVDATGHPRNVKIARSLGMGLDEKAIEAVEKWKFAPGMKDGYPVATRVEVEVNFHLY
jgi:TonB family protein